MANQRDSKFEEQEDGEYHFSDDQINYEMEDVQATEELKPVPTESVVAKTVNYRRYIIVSIIFIVLIYMVSKVLVPATPVPPTEIAQATAKSTMPVPAASQAKSMPVPPSPLQIQPPPQAMMQMPSAPLQKASSPPSVQAQQPAVPASLPADIKTVINKLSVLEEQNTKLTNVLDANSQKLSSYEAQNTVLQAKVLELTTRLANIESGLSQLSQMQGDKSVQTTAATQSSAVPPPVSQAVTGVPSSAKPSEPRILYTVQAIIPGRAWLKSDAGDTVTVAEGDVLKSFGRVIKLDPYDGIVEVDTGTRVITLTYGGGAP